jgi:hypothetical protein
MFVASTLIGFTVMERYPAMKVVNAARQFAVEPLCKPAA